MRWRKFTRTTMIQEHQTIDEDSYRKIKDETKRELQAWTNDNFNRKADDENVRDDNEEQTQDIKKTKQVKFGADTAEHEHDNSP